MTPFAGPLREVLAQGYIDGMEIDLTATYIVGCSGWIRKKTGHADTSTCAVCGSPLLRPGVQDTCSNKCRQRAYRLRQAATPAERAVQPQSEAPPMKTTPHKMLLLRLKPTLVRALKAQAKREDRSVNWIVERDLSAIYLKKGTRV